MCRTGMVTIGTKGADKSQLFTKDGKPLTVRADDIFDASGMHVGRRRNNKVYGPDGHYAGTIVGDRVVYRSTDSAGISTSFVQRSVAGTARASRVGSAMWGDEPFQ